MTITFSAIVASTTQDPTVYNNSALQIARAVCEMWSLGMIIYKFLDTTIIQVGANLRKNILEKLCIEIITQAWVIRFYLIKNSS